MQDINLQLIKIYNYLLNSFIVAKTSFHSHIGNVWAFSKYIVTWPILYTGEIVHPLTHLPNSSLPMKAWNRKYIMRSLTKHILLNLCLWHSLTMVMLQSSTICLLSAIVGQSDWGYLHTQIRSTERQMWPNICF